MRFLLLFLFVKLFSLEIVVNTTNDYSVLTMTNDKEFMCKQKDKKTYICKFDSLPSTPVFSTNTLDFTFYPFFSNNKFFLKVQVKNNSIMKSFKKNLYQGYDKHLKHLIKAKKWVIISYKNKLPFLSNKPIKGLKFPLEVDSDFYLKAIDINGNPINDTQSADVADYFSILRQYNKGNLDTDTIDEFVSQYPKSIFLPDVLYLKLKLLDEASNSDEVIKLGNEWLKNYSFNEHLPEVLLILAKNYANQGQTEDATYMYERLFTEYQGSKYAYLGMIYLADQLYSSGDSKRAFQLYKKAFSNTKDINVASLAASRIAQRYLDEGNIKESKRYYETLLKANKKFLLKDKQKAYELANKLASHNLYNLAIILAKELFKPLTVNDDLYEPLLYRLAKWNYEAKHYKEALKYINLYLNKLPFGDFSDELKDLKTKVLFETPDNNTTQMLQRYDEIINKYKNTDFAKQALIKKINLLYKLKKYNEILSIPKIMDINKTITLNSAKYVTIEELNKDCNKAMKYYTEFNLTLDKKYDESLYKCAYQTNHFEIASQVCNKYLISPDKKIALKWLINKAKVFDITNNYQKLALIVDDICNLTKHCYKWKYKQFFAYYYLNKPDQFLAIASKLLNKDNVKNIDIFMKVVLYGLKTKNNLLVYTYAKKILQLEKKYNTFVNTPFIDFTFVETAKKLHKPNEAIKVLKHLVTLNISDENKAKAYYMLASLTSNKIYLQKCVKLKKSKTWMPLCKDSLELYQ